jgi:hypothetical protein
MIDAVKSDGVAGSGDQAADRVVVAAKDKNAGVRDWPPPTRR